MPCSFSTLFIYIYRNSGLKFHGEFVLIDNDLFNQPPDKRLVILDYEVAAELSETLSHATKGTTSLEAVQAVFPSITKFGMAALLPGKEISANEKIDVFVDGNPTSSTAQRGTILNSANSESVAVTYKDLLQMKKQERRELVAGKEIIYIYHNTIDALGDKAATETKVFEACNDAIDELTAIVKIIVNDLSGVNIFITADHGFLSIRDK